MGLGAGMCFWGAATTCWHMSLPGTGQGCGDPPKQGDRAGGFNCVAQVMGMTGAAEG